MNAKDKVYKEKSGLYVCKHTEYYKGKKKIVKGTSHYSIRDAKEAHRLNTEKWIQSIDKKEDIKEGNIKFEDAIYKWFNTYKSVEKLKDRSKLTYETLIKQICKAPFANTNIAEITSDELQEYLTETSKKMSLSSTKQRFTMLSMFFNKTDLKINPMNKCVLPDDKKNEPKKEKKAYDADQIEKIRNYVMSDDSKDHPKSNRVNLYGKAILVCLYHYLRFGELTGLKVKDVDLNNNFLNIQRQYDQKLNIETYPKYHSERHVPISEYCIDILNDACKGRGKEEILFCRPTKEKDKHIKRLVFDNALNDIAAACEIPRHTIHDLRHDGISFYVNKGIPVHYISKWAGHKSIMVTMDMYYRPPENLDESVMSMVNPKYKKDKSKDKTKGKITIDLKGISEYAAQKGISVPDLSDEEKQKFITNATIADIKKMRDSFIV